VPYFGDLVLLQTTEESQFDHTGCARIGFFQFRQCLIQSENVFIVSYGVPAFDCGQAQPLLCASAFFRDAGPRMIDQYSPHGLCGYLEEVGAIFKVDRL
jgi:hypothetical protein